MTVAKFAPRVKVRDASLRSKKLYSILPDQLLPKAYSQPKPSIQPLRLVHELLHYDLETGHFTWKWRDRKWFKSEHDWKRWNTRYAVSRHYAALGQLRPEFQRHA